MKKLINFFFSALVLLEAPTLFAQGSLKVTEITIEKCSSWQGSMHKYILRSDGNATLVVPNVESSSAESRAYLGKFYEFARLEQSIATLGFFKLQGRYEDEVYDANTVVVGIVRGGKRYEVVNYADAGPVNLWSIQLLISAVAEKIKWNKEPDPKRLKYEPCASNGAPPNNPSEADESRDF